MKKLLLISLSICISFLGIAQNKMDIINQEGTVITTIDAKYCEFYHGYAIIAKEVAGSEQYGIMDLKTLEYIVKPNPEYALIEWYNHDAFGKVHTENGMGLINLSTGKMVIPIDEHNIMDKKGAYIKTTKTAQRADGKYYTKSNIYDVNGKIVYSDEQDLELTEGNTFFKKQEKGISGPYAIDGTQLPTHTTYNDVGFIYFSNGYSVLEKNGKEGLIDEKGKVILPFEFDKISTNENELIIATKDDNIGFLNYDGKVISPYKPKNNTHYINNKNLVIYKNDNLSGIIDLEGNYLTKPRYKKLNTVGEVVYYVDTDNSSGVLSAKGEELINLGADIEITRTSATVFAAKMDGNTGLLTVNGEELLPFEFENITHLDGDYWSVSDRASNYGIYDAKKQTWLYNMNLQSAREYYGIITFSKDGYMGAIHDNLIVPPTKYKNINSGGNGYISAIK